MSTTCGNPCCYCIKSCYSKVITQIGTQRVSKFTLILVMQLFLSLIPKLYLHVYLLQNVLPFLIKKGCTCLRSNVMQLSNVIFELLQIYWLCLDKLLVCLFCHAKNQCSTGVALISEPTRVALISGRAMSFQMRNNLTYSLIKPWTTRYLSTTQELFLN